MAIWDVLTVVWGERGTAAGKLLAVLQVGFLMELQLVCEFGGENERVESFHGWTGIRCAHSSQTSPGTMLLA